MADLGLHVRHAPGDGAGWHAWAHRLFDDLPPAVSTIWLSDHFQIDGKPWWDVWTQLSWVAATFPNVRVGTQVISQSFRNPGQLGVMAATLQELSGGRLILGLGAGWLEEEYRAFNYDYPSGGTRVAQLAETIELLKALWATSPTTFQGEHYVVSDAVAVHPRTSIPIMVGSHGRKAVRVAARLADWWQWDGPLELTYREPFERLRAECEAIGRPFESITKSANIAIDLPDDTSTFEATYTNELAYPGQVFGVVGPTPADVVREIEALVDFGVEHIVLEAGEADCLKLLREVVPNVRLLPTTQRT